MTSGAPNVPTAAQSPVRPRLDDVALQGVAGKVVLAVEPYSEADRAALLATLLSACGAVIGREAYVMAGDAEQAPRVWPLVIGKTAGGMKGTSWSAISRILLAAAPSFADNLDRGLSSGEGLIDRVRDPHGHRDDKDFDEGVADKRVLIVESEFASVLGRSRSDGNTLSEILRQAWDGGRLSTMTKRSNRLAATGAHISVIGHITPTELRKKLSASDIAGGLMNRFLPVHSERSKRLPEGGSIPTGAVAALGAELAVALACATNVRGKVCRDAEATELWASAYVELTPDLPDGPVAAVVARGAPQVLRLSLIYALLDAQDGEACIRAEHLRAALAVWRYVECSARMIFGDLDGDADLTKLTHALNTAGEEGMTRNQVGNLFRGHKSSGALDELVGRLKQAGRCVEVAEPGAGRTATRYYAVAAQEKREKREKLPSASAGTNPEAAQDGKAKGHLPLIPLIPLIPHELPPSAELGDALPHAPDLREDVAADEPVVEGSDRLTKPTTESADAKPEAENRGGEADVPDRSSTMIATLTFTVENDEIGTGNGVCTVCGRRRCYTDETITRGVCASCWANRKPVETVL